MNLVGRTVDCIKTPANREEILRSRVESTRILGEAMRRLTAPPPVWVQMSTAHIYGDPPDLICTEDSPFGVGLAPFVGRAWEDEFSRGALESQRQVVLRTSFVVGRKGVRIGLPAPAFAVRLGARLLMRTDPDLALYGRYVVSGRLEDEGFEFQFPELEAALRDLL